MCVDVYYNWVREQTSHFLSGVRKKKCENDEKCENAMRKKYVRVEDIKEYFVSKFQQNTSHKLTKSTKKKEIRGEIFSAIIEKIDKPVPKKIELRTVALIKDTVVNYPS